MALPNSNPDTFINLYWNPSFNQKHIVKAPPYSSHSATNLLESYALDGFPPLVGPSWPLISITSVIHKGPHTSTLTLDTTTFVCEELQERGQREFSIILFIDDSLTYFGTRRHISLVASVGQTNCRPWLICNASAAQNQLRLLSNALTKFSVNPQAIQFGVCLPCLLQHI